MMQEFVQQIENAVREAVYDMHTAIPGTITAYDAATGRASVHPEGRLTMKNGKQLNYPPIVGVPVVFPQGAGQKASIAYPVKPGDGCLIVVCENDLKPWMSHGKETDGNMKFDLTNSVCIPGLLGMGNEAAVKACREDAVVLRNEETEVVIKRDGMTAAYKESGISLGGQEVAMNCSEIGISISRDGIEINGDVSVNGMISSLGGG